MKKITKVLLGAALLATATGMTSCANEKTSYKVGVCQLVQHVALDAATKGFQDALLAEAEKAGKTVEFDIQNASGDSATCTTIANKFVSANYDLIMANATPALQAVANSTTTIPVLGTSVTDYATALSIKNWTGTVGGNISGTADLAPLEQQAKMFKELVPTAKNVGILFCSAEANSKYQADVVKSYLEKDGYTVQYYTFADSNDVSAVASTAAAKSDALYIPTDNTVASNTDTVFAAINNNKVPVIAGEEGICKGCGVATLSIDYYGLGEITGKMAADVLFNGADISKMEVKYFDNPVYEYNADACKELGITVPSNYVALN